MGFGTLFIGCFFLLNIAYYAFTDLIAALVIILALYRLKAVNSQFKSAMFVLLPFSVLAFYELIKKITEMFSPALSNGLVDGIIGIIRYALLAAATFLILWGIEAVSKEVDLPRLQQKSKKLKILSLIAYVFCMLLEIPSLDKIIPLEALAIVSFIVLVFSFGVTIALLTAVYSAYMYICMPEDLLQKEKPSKFGFVRKFQEHEAEKQAEYANYKLEKLKRNSEKKKKGKK